MKNSFSPIVMLIVATIILSFTSCAKCKHEYERPTCTEPAFCSLCGETTGIPNGHTWENATCTTPESCSVCNAMNGEALGHSWEDATCTTPKTCSLCKITDGETIEHTWEEATCSTPKLCSLCGITEGDKLEHIWIEATCSTPKTCSLCDTKEGNTLEHYVEKWETTLFPSCVKTGKEEGVCTYCGEILSHELEVIDHNPGEWVVTKEATSDEEGEKSQSCISCAKLIKTESFTLSKEELKQQYMNKCVSYSYNEIARNPNSYDGKYAKFTGEVIQVQRQNLFGLIIYTLRVDVTKKGYNWYDDTVYVTYYAGDEEAKILEDDIITMYGELTGEKTYETVLGSSVTIPSFTAEYIDIN